MARRRNRRARPRIYVETSVWSRLFDARYPDRRRQTREFFRALKGRVRWRVSHIVARELERAPNKKKRHRLLRRVRTFRTLELIAPGGVSIPLAELIREQIGTPARRLDLLHLAYALKGEVDYLVSWDLRHLVNERVNRRLLAFCLRHGYNPMKIGTPRQIMRWLAE